MGSAAAAAALSCDWSETIFQPAGRSGGRIMAAARSAGALAASADGPPVVSAEGVGTPRTAESGDPAAGGVRPLADAEVAAAGADAAARAALVEASGVVAGAAEPVAVGVALLPLPPPHAIKIAAGASVASMRVRSTGTSHTGSERRPDP